MMMYGENMEEKRICEKILICLPENFEPIVAVLEETKDFSTLKSQELWASLKVYEQRLLRHYEKIIESAFKLKLNLDSKKPAMKKIEYKSESTSNFKGKGKWNKGGANSNKYTKSDSQQKDSRYKGDGEQSGRAEGKEEKQKMFCACQSAMETSKSKVWFVDSDCINHMSDEKILFLGMDISINSLVKMGDGNMVQANGRGTIRMKTINGAKYVRDLEYTVHFEDGYCTIYNKKDKDKRQVMESIKIEKNKSFPIVFEKEKNVAMRMETIDETWLWHKRLGHLNFNSLKVLSKNNMVQELPQHINHKDRVCEGCALGSNISNHSQKV
ncbi:uncharacterized protein LOC113359415 [Papaver somniferum]|uniref:uncharacterized protein LOC113359415 n=1 Tax=Papaver somniferum TaxID=3469 RepID=UPI000E6FB15E|nr:uncharacterized protein LOC113359415 [Papaver somniferum]